VDAPTERRNPRTLDIDQVGTRRVLELLNAEDALVAGAVARVLDPLAEAVDVALERLRGGGRVHYFGAGTSGRLAVVDAAELLPTFGVAPGTVIAHHAGGQEALERAVEDVEDDETLGARDAAAATAADFAMGLAASGRTPYVAGALRAAREVGAATVLVTANPEAPLARFADVVVAVETGSEAITGSTRLKAGTAQKLVLNSFSTALMVRLGYTYSNLMVGMVTSNAKLRGRMVALLEEATGLPAEACRHALATGGDAKVALVMLLTGRSATEAHGALADAGGHVRGAVATLAAPGA
jgi:N-acetylmuramic acid 6-phosphate etherase